ncbi:MAG: hypothetical protein KKH04_19145 [Proteobacteria bacterium]|nr:hypothetical protein [Pseudomonadota bacterium]
MSKYIAKRRLKKTYGGLYRKPQAIDKVDGRTKPRKAWKAFVSGIQNDLGGDSLSFGQRALAELAFWKYFALSEFIGTLLRSKKDNAILAIMTNEKYNRTFNTTANSCRGDLRDIYGPKGIRKMEKRMKSLNEQLLEIAQGQQPQEEEGQGEDKKADQNG